MQMLDTSMNFDEKVLHKLLNFVSSSTARLLVSAFEPNRPTGRSAPY
jgi:hypothetical protein